MKKVALITGITGQDGSYLAELLLKKGYIVHGIKRRSSTINTNRINHLFKEIHEKENDFFLHYGDLTDSTNLLTIIKKIKPIEIYNLGAQSHVKVSFELPEYTSDTNALGSLRILEAIRILGLEKIVKFYQASSSELYGKVQQIPQNELTPFYPRSPYAVSKLYAFWITKNYREAYGIYACNGILFNHESPKRGETFVTRKIVIGLKKIIFSKQKKLFLGNLDSKRDWGHARDYVEAMWLMMQQKEPKDYVIATGINITVRQFLIKAFNYLGVSIIFKGTGLKEKGYIDNIDKKKYYQAIGISCEDKFLNRIGEVVVEINPRYFRPTEVKNLVGDASMAKKELSWQPKYDLDLIIAEMINEEIQAGL